MAIVANIGERFYKFPNEDDYLKARMIYDHYDGLQEDFEAELENCGIVFYIKASEFQS